MEEKYKIHAFYVLLILIAIIIGLVTIKWAEVPKLIDYITFALTVTSLILAILAIIYTIYASTSSQNYITSLGVSAKELSMTSKEISESTKELSNKVDLIPEHIESVSYKVEEAKTILLEMSTGTESVKEIESHLIGEEFLNNFVQVSSFAGLQALHACSLSHIKEIPFDYIDLAKDLTFLDDTYGHGFIVASHASGILKMRSNKNVFSILFFNEYLQKNLPEAIDNKIGSISDEDVDFSQELIKDKIKVEEYFS